MDVYKCAWCGATVSVPTGGMSPSMQQGGACPKDASGAGIHFWNKQ